MQAFFVSKFSRVFYETQVRPNEGLPLSCQGEASSFTRHGKAAGAHQRRHLGVAAAEGAVGLFRINCIAHSETGA